MATTQAYLHDEDPVWGEGKWKGTGGGTEAQQFYAYKKIKELFGRPPTQVELDMLSPAFNSGDKNIANITGGNSVVAQYYQNQTNTPEKQQADQESKYLEDAPKYYEKLGAQFRSVLGRDATDDEKAHFGKLLASGQADEYTLGQFLTQLPESVRKQDEQFRSGLRDTLKTEDARYFNEQIMPGIQSSFAKSGRDVASSGFANALAQAAQGQNTSREGFLTGLTSDQYQGNKANAYNEYLNNVGRIDANKNYSRQRTDQLMDRTQQRIYDTQDYAMQKQAYDEYLQRYGKKSSGQGIGSLAGGLIGGGLGAYFGGPVGLQAGYTAGSGIGGAGGSFF